MDHINSVRAALKAASVKGSAPPVLAIPIPEPRTDSLGLGIVIYWPYYEWPKDVD